MPRKAKAKIAKPRTRRLSFYVTIECDIAEHKIPLMLKEMPDLLDELRSEDKERQILSMWATVHDYQDPVAEYEYMQKAGAENDVREARVAEPEYLSRLGYKLT